MVLVKHMFHESYSAHGERDAKNSDPVQYYNDMMSYVFGNTVIDMNAANDAISNFKVNKTHKFAIECVRWETLCEYYKYARNGIALEEDRKKGFLMKHVHTDSRIPWSTTMNYCNLNNMSYDATVSMLHHACVISLEDMQVIRMNKVTTRPQQSSHTSHRQPSQSSQREHSSRRIQQATQSSTKQYCRNYQVNNEADPNFVSSPNQ
jgi:hypothetical protein